MDEPDQITGDRNETTREADKQLSRRAQPARRGLLSRRRTLFVVALVAVAALVAGLWLFSEKHAAPRCARLLPESDAILYFNLRPLRAATHFDRHPVTHDQAYQRFIDATGVDFERDLDESAFALHRSSNPFGPNGPVAYSEVFRGRFDRSRLSAYLARCSQTRETYAGHTVYSIPSEGRTVRISLLSGSLVLMSNTPTSEQIHSMLDHADHDWLPWAGGNSLLAAHYGDVPLLSLAWGLGQLGLPFADHGALRLLGMTLPFRLETTFVASLRWTGSLGLRIEQIAPSEQAAAAGAASLQALLQVARFAENNLPGAMVDQNTRDLLNSAVVTHSGDRATLNATLPSHFFEKLVAAPQAIAPAASKR